MAEPGYFKLRHGISRNAVMLRLPPAARWAFIHLLDVAKEQGGVFDSEEQLIESMGSDAQWLSLLRQTACDPEGTLLEGPDGLTVHEWPEHQDDLPTIISKRNAKAGRQGGLRSANQPRQGGRFAPINHRAPSERGIRAPTEQTIQELSSIPPSATERHRAYGVRDGDGDIGTTPDGEEGNRVADGLDAFLQNGIKTGDEKPVADVIRWLRSRGKYDANEDDVQAVLAESSLDATELLMKLERMRADQMAGQTAKALLHYAALSGQDIAIHLESTTLQRGENPKET